MVMNSVLEEKKDLKTNNNLTEIEKKIIKFIRNEN